MSENVEQDPLSREVPPPGTWIGGRYCVEGVLGSGGTGVVVSARFGDRRCAIKLYLAGGSGILHRYHRERKAMLELRHPSVVVAFDAGWYGDVPYLVMEQIDGRPPAPLTEHLPPWTAGPAHPALKEAARPILRLLDVLELLHSQGWVHRDISPANVLVEPDGRVRLLDLGLAAPAGERLRMGTWGWMAPEQALGREVGPAADLYACGALLYYLLTGAPPWGALRGPELLRVQLTRRLAPPQSQNPSIPTPLGEVLLSLLAPDPRERPADAREARALIVAALEGDQTERESSARPYWTLLGREHELARLHARVAQVLDGQVVTAQLLLGEAGIGKTRLAEEALAIGLMQGLTPLRLPQGRSVRLQAAAAQELWAREENLGDPEAMSSGEDSLALLELRALLSLRAPCVLVAEDLHQGSPLAEALLREPLPPGVLLVASSRADPPAGLHPSVEVLLLPPLEARDLLPLVDGETGSELAALLIEVSDGNPLLALESLRGWRQSGRVRRVAKGWEIEAALKGEVESGAALFIPDRFAAALRERASALSPEARTLLELVAALGGQATFRMLAPTGALPESVDLESLTQVLLRAQLLVETDTDPPRYRLFHHHAADVLARDLRPATMRRWASRAVDAEPELPSSWRVTLLNRAGRIYEAARLEMVEAEALEAAGHPALAAPMYARCIGCLAGEEREQAQAGLARCQG